MATWSEESQQKAQVVREQSLSDPPRCSCSHCAGLCSCLHRLALPPAHRSAPAATNRQTEAGKWQVKAGGMAAGMDTTAVYEHWLARSQLLMVALARRGGCGVEAICQKAGGWCVGSSKTACLRVGLWRGESKVVGAGGGAVGARGGTMVGMSGRVLAIPNNKTPAEGNGGQLVGS